MRADHLMRSIREAYLALLAVDPFLAIQHALQSRWLDSPMSALTLACDGLPLFILGCVLLAMSAPRTQSRTRSSLSAAVAVAIALGIADSTAYLLKRALRTPRPLGILDPSLVHVLLFPAREMGLPSGHCVRVAALAAFVTGLRPGRFRWLWLFAFLGGVSRIYVGAHWTFDVLGGWAVGSFIGWLAALVVTRARARSVGSSPSF